MAEDPENVRTSLSFTEGIADTSLFHLLELARMLRSYREGMVIVGGWVPYFLLKQFQRKGTAFSHVGSIDIDIAINPEVINETQYATLEQLLRARGYEPNPKIEFSYIKKVQTGLGEREIEIDFLAPDAGGTSRSHRNQRVQNDFLARKAKGADLAFSHRFELTLEGILPNGAETTGSMYVADIVAIMAMKGYVLGQRLKEKDAYDIFSLLLYYKDGISSVAEELKPFINLELMQESLRNLSEHFRTQNADGPTLVADFFRDEGEQRDQRKLQAYRQVQRLLELLSE